MNKTQLIASIAAIAAVTAGIRFLPFLIFSGGKTPKWVTYLGKVLPYAVMGMLVVYCLKDVSFSSLAGFLPALIASALTALSYALKRNTLLSIILGTVCYMLLIQFVFV